MHAENTNFVLRPCAIHRDISSFSKSGDLCILSYCLLYIDMLSDIAQDSVGRHAWHIPYGEQMHYGGSSSLSLSLCLSVCLSVSLSLSNRVHPSFKTSASL